MPIATILAGCFPGRARIPPGAVVRWEWARPGELLEKGGRPLGWLENQAIRGDGLRYSQKNDFRTPI